MDGAIATVERQDGKSVMPSTRRRLRLDRELRTYEGHLVELYNRFRRKADDRRADNRRPPGAAVRGYPQSGADARTTHGHSPIPSRSVWLVRPARRIASWSAVRPLSHHQYALCARRGDWR